jgi:hypothetical protein
MADSRGSEILRNTHPGPMILMDFHAVNKALFSLSHTRTTFLDLASKLGIARKVFGAFPAHCKPVINAGQTIVVNDVPHLQQSSSP